MKKKNVRDKWNDDVLLCFLNEGIRGVKKCFLLIKRFSGNAIVSGTPCVIVEFDNALF